MNHLAHFHLSFGKPHLIVGNWLADVVKGRRWEAYSVDIQQGIHLHRSIDSFTDAHPLTHSFAKSIRPFAGKYAGPATDILRDYLLTKNWETFSDVNIETYAALVYDALSANIDLMPEELKFRTQKMIAANWLVKYDTLERIKMVFDRFQSRLREPIDVDGLLEFVQKEEGVLSSQFLMFYADLRDEMAKIARS